MSAHLNVKSVGVSQGALRLPGQKVLRTTPDLDRFTNKLYTVVFCLHRTKFYLLFTINRYTRNDPSQASHDASCQKKKKRCFFPRVDTFSVRIFQKLPHRTGHDLLLIPLSEDHRLLLLLLLYTSVLQQHICRHEALCRYDPKTQQKASVRHTDRTAPTRKDGRDPADERTGNY